MSDQELKARYTIFQCSDCGFVYGSMSIGDPRGTIDPCPDCLSVLGSYRIRAAEFDFHKGKMNKFGKQQLEKEIIKSNEFKESI